MEAVAMDRLIEKGGATPQLAQAIGEALDITLKAANLVTVPMLDARFAQFEAKMEARFGALERSIESTKVWAILLYAGMAVPLFGALAVDHRWLLNREDEFMAQIQARFAAEDARTDRVIAEERARTEKSSADDRARFEKGIAEDRAQADKLIAGDRTRFEQSISEGRAQTDRMIAEDRARFEKSIAEERAKTDKLIAEDDARSDKSIAEQRVHADRAEARMDAKLNQLRLLLLKRSGGP